MSGPGDFVVSRPRNKCIRLPAHGSHPISRWEESDLRYQVRSTFLCCVVGARADVTGELFAQAMQRDVARAEYHTFAPCVAVSASRPMSARSRWSSRSRRIVPGPTSRWVRTPSPLDLLPVVLYDRRAGERSLDLLRWGLMPHWAKDINVGFTNINAKAEGIENRPAFRDAFERRHCLVPIDSFYEWKKTATGKQPYAIALADRGLMALAGVWENWRSPAGEWVRSFAVITTKPNELCAEPHNRMPVVLGPETWPTWLGEEPASLKPCSRPTPRKE